MEKEKLCVIFGAGEVFAPAELDKNDLVIAADGGYAKAVASGLTPDIVIGDFDSGEMPCDTEAFVIKLNRDKDETDMLAAVRVGLRRGCRTFVLYGGVGGRLDHTVANLHVLLHLNSFDAKGFLVDERTVATVITDGKFILPDSAKGVFSVFAYGGVAEGVTLKGVKFPLENHTLTPDFPLGVSNETLPDRKTEISVKHGSLLIFFPRATR